MIDTIRYIILKKILRELVNYSLLFRFERISTKTDLSPVTELDIINQYIIETSIRKYFPTDKIIAEEDTKNEFSISTIKKYSKDINRILNNINKNIISNIKKDDNENYTWFIDPIDGTKGFIDGLAFAIAISVLENDNLSFSGLACIGLKKALNIDNDIIISLTNGKEIDLIDENLNRISPFFNSERTLVISRKHASKSIVQFLHTKGYNTMELDSQAKYLSVLLNLSNIYIREQGSCGNSIDYAWDHLAGIHLLKVAGGLSLDINRNPPCFSSKKEEISFQKCLITSNSEKEMNQIIKYLKEYYE